MINPLIPKIPGRRKVFLSFHYENDYWQAQQVRQMGVIEDQRIALHNEWESIKRNGDAAIKRWIDEQMYGKTCLIVLIGSQTADRKWVQYEISSAWNAGKGVIGIHIDQLKNRHGYTTLPGRSPFNAYKLRNGRWMSDYVPVMNPAGGQSNDVYSRIQYNLGRWIEQGITARLQADAA